MDEERSYVVFEDDEGNEFELDIIDMFEHKSQLYAVLMDLNGFLDDDGQPAKGTEEEPREMYIMKVEGEEGAEQFTPIDDEALLDELSEVVYSRIEEADEEES